MKARIFAAMDRLERWLRIDQATDLHEIIRARAVYVIGFAFILLQVGNLVSMRVIDGRFGRDHLLSLAACSLLATIILMLRYSRRFSLFAAGFSLLLITSISATAILSGQGIFSTLLTLLVVGVLVNATVAGYRATLIYVALSSAVIWGLFAYSVQINSQTVETQYSWQYMYHRAFQAQLALILLAIVSTLILARINELINALEDSLDRTRASERVKTEFLANMSHEIRTPLNGIIGMSGLLLKSELQPQQREYAGIVNDCSKGLVSIVNDVLDLSKLDVGRVALQPGPMDLLDLLTKLTSLHRPTAQHKHLDLVLDWDPHLPQHIIGDPVRLRQIANNLLGNAVKFTTAGGVRLSVRGAALADDRFHYAIYVSDTGRGIGPADLERVFGRFEQVDDGYATMGTGLGLSIAKELVEAMGGQIRVHSEIGRGTVFRVDLAVQPADMPSLRAAG